MQDCCGHETNRWMAKAMAEPRRVRWSEATVSTRSRHGGMVVVVVVSLVLGVHRACAKSTSGKCCHGCSGLKKAPCEW